MTWTAFAILAMFILYFKCRKSLEWRISFSTRTMSTQDISRRSLRSLCIFNDQLLLLYSVCVCDRSMFLKQTSWEQCQKIYFLQFNPKTTKMRLKATKALSSILIKTSWCGTKISFQWKDCLEKCKIWHTCTAALNVAKFDDIISFENHL